MNDYERDLFSFVTLTRNILIFLLLHGGGVVSANCFSPGHFCRNSHTQICPSGHYCSGNGRSEPCPPGSTVPRTGLTTMNECLGRIVVTSGTQTVDIPDVEYLEIQVWGGGGGGSWHGTGHSPSSENGWAKLAGGAGGYTRCIVRTSDLNTSSLTLRAGGGGSLTASYVTGSCSQYSQCCRSCCYYYGCYSCNCYNCGCSMHISWKEFRGGGGDFSSVIGDGLAIIAGGGGGAGGASANLYGIADGGGGGGVMGSAGSRRDSSYVRPQGGSPYRNGAGIDHSPADRRGRGRYDGGE